MSAGIEKFYSMPQFLTVEVAFLCQAALAIAIVRCVAYGRPGGHRTRCGLFLGFLLLWCLEEMLSAVAPSAGHVRFYLLAGAVLPLMPALLFAAGRRKDGRLPDLLLYPLLFVVLLAAVAAMDVIAHWLLAPRGLFTVPVARPLFWVLPSAAVALATCASVVNLVGRQCNPRLAAGMLVAYGSFLASRLVTSPLPLDLFILTLPIAVALIARGVETPLDRVLTLTQARQVMRCLPEHILVFDAGLRRAGGNDGLLAGLIADCRTLDEVIGRLRSVSSRWTLDDLDERSLTDPTRRAVYYEGELSLSVPEGTRDFQIGLGPVRNPGGSLGCVLSLQDITSQRADLREAERAYADLRAVRERLERYATATLPREITQDNRERAEALRERTRARLLAAAAGIRRLRRETVRQERISTVADQVRACLADVRETVGRMREGE